GVFLCAETQPASAGSSPRRDSSTSDEPRSASAGSLPLRGASCINVSSPSAADLLPPRSGWKGGEPQLRPVRRRGAALRPATNHVRLCRFVATAWCFDLRWPAATLRQFAPSPRCDEHRFILPFLGP